MIRAVVPEDVDELLQVADAIGFEPEETDTLRSMLSEYFQDAEGSRHGWFVDEEEDALVSVAYSAPERMTQGTWNLYMIAVRPEYQGQGKGSAMMRHIESDLKRKEARLLIVETSGLDDFKPAQTFYLKNGFEKAAHIRDFYAAGNDKIIFCKPLAN